MANLLEMKNVTKIFGGSVIGHDDSTVAVDNVTLSILDDHPTIIAIAGESGSGKTTLSLLMQGQIAPTSGQVYYRGKNLVKMSADEKMQLRREVQPIFQDPYAAYNPFYRVDHVLQTPIKHFGLAKTNAEANQRIIEAMEMVGLRPAETLGRYPHQLSGGQRQRLMVARALLCHPQMIMADEPVSMVDASLRATILASLSRLKQDFAISVVYITHDLTTAYQIAENIIIMYSGSVVETGTVDQVIRNPKHPYTQLLVASIPLPDKSKNWGGREAEDSSQVARKAGGCKFANRCPLVMEQCWSSKPPLYTTDENRAVSCFHYNNNPVMSSPDVSTVFR